MVSGTVACGRRLCSLAVRQVEARSAVAAGGAVAPFSVVTLPVCVSRPFPASAAPRQLAGNGLGAVVAARRPLVTHASDAPRTAVDPVSCRLPDPPPVEELKRRREAVARQVAPGSVIVIPSAPTVYMTNDIPFRFRQNSNFFYLTGLARETPAALVMVTTDTGHVERTIVVTRKQSETDRLWHGRRMTAEEAASRCGPDVEPAYEHTLADTLGHRYTTRPVAVSSSVQYDKAFLDSVLKHFPSITGNPMSATGALDAVRVVKSAYELEQMQASTSIAARAFRVTMATAHAGQNEHAIDSHLEHAFRQAGASMHAYPPVVAGGSNALTLHYIENNQVVGSKGGHDLALVDAGCEYGHYCSDITRCWPAGRRFSEAQVEVYNAVLAVQLNCLEALEQQMVSSLRHLHQLFLSALEVKALDLGLISPMAPTTTRSTLLRQLCPHGIGHYIGLDVHDTPSVAWTRGLEAGMVITVEPGLYIPDDNRFPQRLRGIGVRIEDDVAITREGTRVLSRHCPKTIAEVEAAMGGPSPSQA